MLLMVRLTPLPSSLTTFLLVNFASNFCFNRQKETPSFLRKCVHRKPVPGETLSCPPHLCAGATPASGGSGVTAALLLPVASFSTARCCLVHCRRPACAKHCSRGTGTTLRWFAAALLSRPDQSPHRCPSYPSKFA